MDIPSNSILLVPSSLHLAMYQKILNNKNNCMNIQVISLSTYIHSFLPFVQNQDLSVLYQYRDLLKKISSSNSYKSSTDDIQFLSSCYSFVKWLKLYSLDYTTLPEQTKKDKDIKEIIQLLFSVHLFEDNTENLLAKIPNLDNVYILKVEFSNTEYFWVSHLIEKGAKYLDNSNHPSIIKHWSVANNKKQAQLVAQTILNQNLEANDIYVSTNNESEKQVLAQIFDLYKIPYTLLSSPSISTIPQKWICCLEWIEKKDIASFLSMIEVLYPSNYNTLYEYYSRFPEQFGVSSNRLSSINYEKNNLISKDEFDYLLQLEQEGIDFYNAHSYLYQWDINNIVDIYNEIKSVHIQIEKEDLQAIHSINDSYIEALPYIQSKNDLSIFIQKLKDNISISKPNQIKGVLIGSRKEISTIRPITFLIGAHNKNYPNYHMESGLFNEFYLRKTKLPSLEERLNIQKTLLKDTVLNTEQLFAIYPQSDYEGNSYEKSNELAEWIQVKDEFISIPEYSNIAQSDFTLSQDCAKNLFFNQNVFSVSRLETFSKCPLQHFLKYGLHLKEENEWNDVATRGTILHSVLENISTKYKKQYADIDENTLVEYVVQEFSFALKVYPAKEKWFQSQIKDYVNKLKEILLELKYFENNWHMNFFDSEHKFHKTLKWNGFEIDLIGYVDRIDTSNTSFCIFDYKSGSKELKIDKYQSGLSLQLITYTLSYEEESNLKPVGCFYITLKGTYTDSKAFDVRYPRSKEGVMEEIDSNSNNDFITQAIGNGWSFDGMDIYLDNSDSIKSSKKSLTLEECKEQWPIITQHILDAMASGNIAPDHTLDACMYCKYTRICRNNRNEVTPINYIEEES